VIVESKDADGNVTAEEVWSEKGVRRVLEHDRDRAIEAIELALAVASTESVEGHHNPDYDLELAGELREQLERVRGKEPGTLTEGAWIPMVENVYTMAPPAEPVYDAGTLEMLAELQEAPQRPPADLPSVFGERYYGKKALSDQAARWHGEKAIRSSSAVARAESEADQLAEMIASVEEAIGVLERRFPEKKKAKKNSRRSRRARRTRRR
jgi:hypothetical protein